jgi:hypothetical protein
LSTLGIGDGPEAATVPALPAIPAPKAPRPGFVDRIRRWLLEPQFPPLALEVRSRSVGAVRGIRERGGFGLGTAASLSLPDGVVALSMSQPNVVDREAFRETVRAVLERAGISLHGPIGLVLPDPVARVSLVPAGELVGKTAAEAKDLIRFRIRKAVPFDVKDAQVAYALPRVVTPEAQAVSVVISRAVLEGYEEALASLGLQPGLVELAGLAIQAAAEVARPMADRLIVNWDEGYVSLLLTRAGEPVLIRTLTGETAGTHDDIVREVANTVLYYREKLGGAGLGTVVLRSAVLPPAQAVQLLREPLGMTPEIFDPWSPGGGDASAAAQAVAGAAACVAGKVA